jgi:hypothetical protein
MEWGFMYLRLKILLKERLGNTALAVIPFDSKFIEKSASLWGNKLIATNTRSVPNGSGKETGTVHFSRADDCGSLTATTYYAQTLHHRCYNLITCLNLRRLNISSN